MGISAKILGNFPYTVVVWDARGVDHDDIGQRKINMLMYSLDQNDSVIAMYSPVQHLRHKNIYFSSKNTFSLPDSRTYIMQDTMNTSIRHAWIILVFKYWRVDTLVSFKFGVRVASSDIQL